MSRLDRVKERALSEGMPFGAKRSRREAIDWLATHLDVAERRIIELERELDDYPGCFICEDCRETLDLDEMAEPDEHEGKELCGLCAREWRENR